MPAALLEIVDLGNGTVVLRRADGGADPLVTIHFCAESRAFLQDHRLDVARAMIQAGIEAAAAFANGEVVEEAAVSTPAKQAPILH